MFTQVGVKQLTDFLRTVTAASDLVDCTLVNCVYLIIKQSRLLIAHRKLDVGTHFSWTMLSTHNIHFH